MVSAPAISVIVPMYNAKKYIAKCLDSVLAQTFQNYEVVLVDDASTDGSRKIAERYLEKFGGRLAIYENQKNLGVSATRNKGLKISRGEYVFFLDADDLLLENGLKRLYALAKSCDVDVVNCTGNYALSDNGKKRTLKRLKKPTETLENIIDTDFDWRLKELLNDNFYWASWRKLSRRDFLVKNGLFFPEKLTVYEDQVWTFGLLLRAKKILHTPLAAYLCRRTENSLSRQNRTPLQKVNLFINVIIQGLKWLDNTMTAMPFFEKDSKYRYTLLAHFARRYFKMLYKSNAKNSQAKTYMSIKNKFGKNFGKYDVLVPVILTLVSSYMKNIEENSTEHPVGYALENT